MGGKGKIGLREFGVKPIVQHGLGAGDDLLCGLADHHQRAVPLRLQKPAPWRCRPPGHMAAMPAGVIDKGQLAVHRLPGAAGIGQAASFFHRQRVEFGAQHHHRAGAVFEHADDARFSDSLSNLEA
jgi:hypothetical protein